MPEFEPIIRAGQHKLFVQSHDGLVWLVEPGTHDGFGPHHAEQEPIGNSVHDFIMNQVPEGGVFLDIGAHVGHYTMRAARKALQVIAVEANPATSARLLENLALNKITNVTLLALALWDTPGIVHLAHGTSEEVRSGGMRVLPYETGVGITVPAITLDSLGLAKVDTVKIDTEGADIRILKGMRETIGRCHPTIIVEDHSYLGYYGQADLFAAEYEVTAGMGYTWKDIDSYGVEGSYLNYRIGTHG